MYSGIERPICPICGKVVFKTKGEINAYIKSRNKRKSGDSLRAYYCKECRCWHLTSHANLGLELYKETIKYNRLRKKVEDRRIFLSVGLAA